MQPSPGSIPVDRVRDLVSLEDGTNVLITGEAMTGKRLLLFSLLAARADRQPGTVLVTTRKPAAATFRQFANLDGEIPPDRVSIVDCTGVPSETPGDWEYRSASGPGDLTGVGIGITEFLRRHHQSGEDGQVGLHSLSTMLMYADLKRLFQFVHVLTTRIATTGFVGGFTLDTAVVDEREAAILRQPFDGVVEVRLTDDGGRELRVRGDVAGPETWTVVRRS